MENYLIRNNLENLMEKTKKKGLDLALILIVTILSLNFISAVGCEGSGFRGEFAPGEDFKIGTTCPTCDFINYTVTDPKGDLIIQNQQGQENGSKFYYLHFNNTENYEWGTYFIDGNSNLDFPVALCFKINGGGNTLSISEVIVYTILLILLIIGITVLSYIAIETPFNNEKQKTRDGTVVTKVTKSKYVKLMSIWIAYGLLLWFIVVLTGLTNNYITFEPLRILMTRTDLFLRILGKGLSVAMVWLIFFNMWKDIVLNKEILRNGKAFLNDIT